MIQETGTNLGNPTDVCNNCGGSLVRYLDAGSVNSYQACPDCDK